MKLKNLQPDSDIEKVISELMEKHQIYLSSKKIKKDHIKDLIKRVVEKLKKNSRVPKEVDYNNEDLNKLDDNELALHKKKMDEKYYQNYKDPKSKEFVYIIEQDFNDNERVDDSWDD